jgi:hypothetical protein
MRNLGYEVSVISSRARNLGNEIPIVPNKVRNLGDEISVFSSRTRNLGNEIPIVLNKVRKLRDKISDLKIFFNIEKFRVVKTTKPNSSRKKSSEMYLICLGYKSV